MRFALMIEPQQGMTYADQLAVARRAEAAGIETLLRSDHYESFPGPSGRPTTDAWVVLAGLARETERIRLGVLVSPVTYRLPGPFARAAATVHEMSGGRLELGLGAGWHEPEHRRHGIPFPPIEERAEMLEEQLAIIHGLWEEPDGWSFEGRHYQVQDARFHPQPRPRPRIIVGGDGSPRSMRIAARFADEFNLTKANPDEAAERFIRLEQACRAAGREPSTITHSVMAGVLIGRDEAELADRRGRLLETVATESARRDAAAGEEWMHAREPRWIIGTLDQARQKVARYAAAGVERLVLQDLLPWDLEMIDLIGRELVAQPSTSAAASR